MCLGIAWYLKSPKAKSWAIHICYVRVRGPRSKCEVKNEPQTFPAGKAHSHPCPCGKAEGRPPCCPGSARPCSQHSAMPPSCSPRGAELKLLVGYSASRMSQASLKSKKNGTDHSKTEWDGCPRGSFPVEEYNSWVGKSRHPSLSQQCSGGLTLSCHAQC